MSYNVMRLGNGKWNISGEGVNVECYCYDPFGYRDDVKNATGKGAKKIKEELKPLIQQFIKDERDNTKRQLEAAGEKFAENFIKACTEDIKVWRSIDDRKLYNVELNYGHDGQGYKDETVTHSKLITGKQLKQNINYRHVLNYEGQEIQHTDIYRIGSGRDYQRHIEEDKRIFEVMNTAYVTGLTVKEMLNNGAQLFDISKMRISKEALDEQARKCSNGMIFSILGMAKNRMDEAKKEATNMHQRMTAELARAEQTAEFTPSKYESIIEVFSDYGSFYFGETYESIGDGALDKTVEIQIQTGDYVKGFDTGLFVNHNGHLFNLFHPIENLGNPRKKETAGV